MKQVLVDTLNHPFTAGASGSGAVVVQNEINTGHMWFDTALKILTFAIGIAPAIKQLLSKKKI